MRKQYHFRPSANGYNAWDVDRLIAFSSKLAKQRVLLSEIAEIDEGFWSGENGNALTCRDIAEHARLIEEADLSYPIILCSSRRIMDGMHRVLKALNAGEVSIDAVVFEQNPEPDYTDVLPEDLPY